MTKVTCHVKNLSKVVMLKIETILQSRTKLSKLKLFESKMNNYETIYSYCKARQNENPTKELNLLQQFQLLLHFRQQNTSGVLSWHKVAVFMLSMVSFLVIFVSYCKYMSEP